MVVGRKALEERNADTLRYDVAISRAERVISAHEPIGSQTFLIDKTFAAAQNPTAGVLHSSQLIQLLVWSCTPFTYSIGTVR
jgi:hypothetical protein